MVRDSFEGSFRMARGGEGSNRGDVEVRAGILFERGVCLGLGGIGAKSVGEAIGACDCRKRSRDGAIRIGWHGLCEDLRVEVIGD